MINEEQHLINDDQRRQIHSVPDESTCSKWIEQSRREATMSDFAKDLQDPESWQWKDCCTKSRLSDREEEKSIADR